MVAALIQSILEKDGERMRSSIKLDSHLHDMDLSNRVKTQNIKSAVLSLEDQEIGFVFGRKIYFFLGKPSYIMGRF